MVQMLRQQRTFKHITVIQDMEAEKLLVISGSEGEGGCGMMLKLHLVTFLVKKELMDFTN